MPSVWLSSSSEASLIASIEPNFFSRAFFRFGPMPGMLIQSRSNDFFAAQLPVVTYGETMCFVPGSLQDVEGRRIFGYTDRPGVTRYKYLLVSLWPG